jgi:hypothetical protein
MAAAVLLSVYTSKRGVTPSAHHFGTCTFPEQLRMAWLLQIGLQRLEFEDVSGQGLGGGEGSGRKFDN